MTDGVIGPRFLTYHSKLRGVLDLAVQRTEAFPPWPVLEVRLQLRTEGSAASGLPETKCSFSL